MSKRNANRENESEASINEKKKRKKMEERMIDWMSEWLGQWINKWMYPGELSFQAPKKKTH